MVYKLTRYSHSQLTIKPIGGKQFNLLPNAFTLKTTYPMEQGSFKRITCFEFTWMFWDYQLLMRKPKKK